MFYSYGMHPMRMGPYWLLRCFNPRTHTGCDQALTGQINGLTVSIHAPTRGATVIRVYTFGCSGVSIHAPTRGATLSDNGPFQEMVCFNPRTHTGCDHDRMGKHRSLPVSIHAPTRGATPYRNRRGAGGAVSIHAPTRGATT